MGNTCIIIRTTGNHGNGSMYDAEQVGRRCVDELRSCGHNILSATCETGGGSVALDRSSVRNAGPMRGYTIDHAQPDSPVLRPLTVDEAERLPGYTITNPEFSGQCAYERHCAASGGKSLASGAELPGWVDLKPEIRVAWMAAVDCTKPRMVK